jgi:hypothetical protein
MSVPELAFDYPANPDNHMAKFLSVALTDERCTSDLHEESRPGGITVTTSDATPWHIGWHFEKQ